MTQPSIQKVLQKTAQNEQFIVTEHLLFQALTKMSRYDAECAVFKKKYGQALQTLLETRSAQTEDFDLEDDLLDWQYANATLQWWQSCVQAFQHAAKNN